MNKKEKLKLHRISFLSILLLSDLDELDPSSEIGVNLHQKTKEYIETIEPFIEALYGPKDIRSGTYLTDVSNKIDTLIRKCYSEIH